MLLDCLEQRLCRRPSGMPVIKCVCASTKTRAERSVTRGWRILFQPFVGAGTRACDAAIAVNLRDDTALSANLAEFVGGAVCEVGSIDRNGPLIGACMAAESPAGQVFGCLARPITACGSGPAAAAFDRLAIAAGKCP